MAGAAAATSHLAEQRRQKTRKEADLEGRSRASGSGAAHHPVAHLGVAAFAAATLPVPGASQAVGANLVTRLQLVAFSGLTYQVGLLAGAVREAAEKVLAASATTA